MTRLLKKRAIGYLEAEKIIVESKIEALTRPKEVILKYKELVIEQITEDLINDDIIYYYEKKKIL